MAKIKKATLTRTRPANWTYETYTQEVRVMATAEGYAMVRHKGCVPFVVFEKELTYTEGK